jgi:hypothetical protein
MQPVNGRAPYLYSMASSAKWHVTLMSPGRAAVIQCRGSMPAARSGYGRRRGSCFALGSWHTYGSAVPMLLRPRKHCNRLPSLTIERAALESCASLAAFPRIRRPKSWYLVAQGARRMGFGAYLAILWTSRRSLNLTTRQSRHR